MKAIAHLVRDDSKEFPGADQIEFTPEYLHIYKAGSLVAIFPKGAVWYIELVE
jgi:hypothetical protein